MRYAVGRGSVDIALSVPGFGGGLVLPESSRNGGTCRSSAPRRRRRETPLLLIGNTGALFDWWEQTSVAFLVIPEFFWELFLGIYLIVK